MTLTGREAGAALVGVVVAGCSLAGLTGGPVDASTSEDAAGDEVRHDSSSPGDVAVADADSTAADGAMEAMPLLPDTIPPTIPTGLTIVSSPLDPSDESTNTLTFDYPSDPTLPGSRQTGIGQCNVARDGSPFAFIPAPSPGLTDVFAGVDIGAVGTAGSSVQAMNGTDWTVSGAGGDIVGAVDAFQFDSVQVGGSGTIIAKLSALTGPVHPAEPKVGVMFRQSAADNDPFVMMGYQNGTATVQYRGARGGNVQVPTYSPKLTLPAWLKLSRAGNLFTASTSVDGNAWIVQTTVTVSMPVTVDVGLAVTSQVPGTLAVATFEQVNVENQPSLTFMDTKVPAATTHSYSLTCQDRAAPPNVSAAGSSVSQTTPAVNPG